MYSIPQEVANKNAIKLVHCPAQGKAVIPHLIHY